MEIIRQLFNPYIRTFEVCFKDGVSINETYNIHSKPNEAYIPVHVEIICEPVADDIKFYRTLAREAIMKHIMEKISESIEKNF